MVGRLERGAQECEARLGQHAVEVIREPDGGVVAVKSKA
jgi:hypothetical protein